MGLDAPHPHTYTLTCPLPQVGAIDGVVEVMSSRPAAAVPGPGLPWPSETCLCATPS